MKKIGHRITVTAVAIQHTSSLSAQVGAFTYILLGLSFIPRGKHCYCSHFIEEKMKPQKGKFLHGQTNSKCPGQGASPDDLAAVPCPKPLPPLSLRSAEKNLTTPGLAPGWGRGEQDSGTGEGPAVSLGGGHRDSPRKSASGHEGG